MISLVNANSLSIPLADHSVNCVVTSPPYYGLRDYGVDGQLGLEETPEQFISNLVSVFREVWRVLRDDGVIWVNIGDSYATGTTAARQDGTLNLGGGTNEARKIARIGTPEGCKTKDLIGIPWMLAFALRADGWYLRSDIIWSKPNPMPESVTDRPTKAHEYLFLLSKSPRYYYDNEAVKEDAVNGDPRQPLGSAGVLGHVNERRRKQDELGKRQYTGFNKRWDNREEPLTRRNRRTVWTVATEPTSEAHFATYPRKLVEPCIKAGCPAGGIVLDPFAGSGTTGIVARALGRRFVGMDLSFAYLSTIARKRLSMDALDEWTEGIRAGADGFHDLPLFLEAQ